MTIVRTVVAHCDGKVQVEPSAFTLMLHGGEKFVREVAPCGQRVSLNPRNTQPYRELTEIHGWFLVEYPTRIEVFCPQHVPSDLPPPPGPTGEEKPC